MRVVLASLSLFALLGCTQPIRPGETVSFVVTGPQAAPRANRFDQISVRTFAKSGLTRTELTGLPCTAMGTGLRATFTSPAVLNVPTYLGRTDAVTVTCQWRRDQVQSASKLIEPVNQTAADLETGLRVGLSSSDGVSVRVGVSVRDVSRDRFDFPASVIIDFPAR